MTDKMKKEPQAPPIVVQVQQMPSPPPSTVPVKKHLRERVKKALEVPAGLKRKRRVPKLDPQFEEFRENASRLAEYVEQMDRAAGKRED